MQELPPGFSSRMQDPVPKRARGVFASCPYHKNPDTKGWAAWHHRRARAAARRGIQARSHRVRQCLGSHTSERGNTRLNSTVFSLYTVLMLILEQYYRGCAPYAVLCNNTGIPHPPWLFTGDTPPPRSWLQGFSPLIQL